MQTGSGLEAGHGARSGDTKDAYIVPVAYDDRNQASSTDVHHTLRADALGSRVSDAIVNAMEVRRLTPRECERLQAFPDDHTAIIYKNKPAADGPRYKALGNSMCVNVMRWIGEQIEIASLF